MLAIERAVTCAYCGSVAMQCTSVAGLRARGMRPPVVHSCWSLVKPGNVLKSDKLGPAQFSHKWSRMPASCTPHSCRLRVVKFCKQLLWSGQRCLREGCAPAVVPDPPPPSKPLPPIPVEEERKPATPPRNHQGARGLPHQQPLPPPPSRPLNRRPEVGCASFWRRGMSSLGAIDQIVREEGKLLVSGKRQFFTLQCGKVVVESNVASLACQMPAVRASNKPPLALFPCVRRNWKFLHNS